MHLRTPGGWTFYLRNVLDRRLEQAQLDALQVRFEGFDTQSGMEPTLGSLGPIGALSASPFETEGCLRHAYFVRVELAEMGLPAGRTTVDFDIRQANSRVTTRIELSTPGVSRARYDREETLAKPSSLFKLAEVPTATHSERWDISDDGFVRARNAYCAKQDGVDPQTFVSRHLAAVQRLLETRGLVPDAQTIAAYANFAEKGGQLAFGGTYETPLHSSERDGVHNNGSAWLRMRGSFENGSRKGEVQWRGTKPRPLDAAGGATFAAMTRENGGIPPTVGALSLAPQAQEAIAAAMVASAAPAPGQPPVATVPVSTAPTAAAAAAPVPAAVTAAPATQPPRYASSLPSAQPQLAPAGGRLAWEDLPRYQGRILQVFTMHAEPRTAVLVSANGNEARVRARMEGGHADYRISRESFVRALLVQ